MEGTTLYCRSGCSSSYRVFYLFHTFDIFVLSCPHGVAAPLLTLATRTMFPFPGRTSIQGTRGSCFRILLACSRSGKCVYFTWPWNAGTAHAWDVRSLFVRGCSTRAYFHPVLLARGRGKRINHPCQPPQAPSMDRPKRNRSLSSCPTVIASNET